MMYASDYPHFVADYLTCNGWRFLWPRAWARVAGLRPEYF